MKILGVIPSRYASTRFPGKPLVDILGKTMIQRVYEQAKKSTCLSEVYVATDDQRIFHNVEEFGGKVVMTSELHESGTDRCAETIEKISDNYDAIINIQGDEPFIHIEQIDSIAKALEDSTIEIVTLAKKIENADDIQNPNLVKVVFDDLRKALYFSRSPIPYSKGIKPEDWVKHQDYYGHVGLYGYKTEVLKKISKLPTSSLERAESLEQLRWLQNGFKINIELTELESRGIDTPEDLKKAINELKSK